jgi:hypothetical protein
MENQTTSFSQPSLTSERARELAKAMAVICEHDDASIGIFLEIVAGVADTQDRIERDGLASQIKRDAYMGTNHCGAALDAFQSLDHLQQAAEGSGNN